METISIKNIYSEKDRKTNVIHDNRLKKSIALRIEKGLNPLIQPIALQAVSDYDGFTHEVVDGRRRFAALSALGIAEIHLGMDAVLVKGNSKAMAFIANDERLNLSLWEQITKLKEMLEIYKTIDAISNETGWSPVKIAKRINLFQLSAAWQTCLKENRFPKFTTEHYEAIAAFPSEIQDEIQEYLNSWRSREIKELSAKKFENALHQEFATLLKDLPWEENGCGTCPACLERINGGYLFQDMASLEKARCMNRNYLEEKRNEFISLKIKEDTDLIAVSDSYSQNESVFVPLTKNDYSLSDAKNAKKAILVDGPNAGQVISVKITKKENEIPQQEKIETSLAERKEKKQKQRRRWAIEKLSSHISSDTCMVPDRNTIFVLIACVGNDIALGDIFSYAEKKTLNRSGLPSGIKSFHEAKELQNLDQVVWSEVKERLITELRYGQSGDVTEKWSEAEILSSILNFDLANALTNATEELPDPKSWKILEKNELEKTSRQTI